MTSVRYFSPVPGRVLVHRGEHGCLRGAAAVLRQERGERLGVEERYVPVQHEHLALEVVGERGDRLLDRPARARDLVLVDDDHAGHDRLDLCGHLVALVPHDGDDVRGVERVRGAQHVGHDGRPCERVQQLRSG
jgi:hypothetical protein